MNHASPARAATAFALALFWCLDATVAVADDFQLTGQAHPRFHLSVAVNGTEVKTVEPSPDKMKIFFKSLDEYLIRAGDNHLEVAFERQPVEGRADPPAPSFVIRLKRQTDPTDADTATELVEIRGPDRPFDERPKSGRLRTEFAVEP